MAHATGSLCVNVRHNKHGHIALYGIAGTFKDGVTQVGSVIASYGNPATDHEFGFNPGVRNVKGDGSQAAISLKGLKTGSSSSAAKKKGSVRSSFELTSGTLYITLKTLDGSTVPVVEPITDVLFVDDVAVACPCP